MCVCVGGGGHHRARQHGLGLRGVSLKDMEEALEADGSENRYLWTAPDGT